MKNVWMCIDVHQLCSCLHVVYFWIVHTSAPPTLFSSSCTLQLSASCRDLLNKIFNVDPISRITIPEIIEHPWYNMELPEKYQSVLDRLAVQQGEVDEWLGSCEIDQGLVDEREDLLRLMVKEAGTQVTDRSMHNVGALQIVDYQRQDIKHINLMHAAIEVGSPGIEVCVCQGVGSKGGWQGGAHGWGVALLGMGVCVVGWHMFRLWTAVWCSWVGTHATQWYNGSKEAGKPATASDGAAPAKATVTLERLQTFRNPESS